MNNQSRWQKCWSVSLRQCDLLTAEFLARKPMKKNNFEIGAKDIPDKYVVSASTGESLLRLVGDEEKGVRLKSSEVMDFGAKDESREVILQFDAETPNQ